MTPAPHSPFDGVNRASSGAAALVFLIALALTGAATWPPAQPALAAPAASASSSAASADGSPSASPSAATSTPAPAPSGSPASPSPAPSGMPAAPSTSPSPQASPSASPAPSAAESEAKKIEMITGRMEHLNPTLKDWTSDVSIDARVKLSLLVLPMELHGRSYHKAPDKYKFELQNAPALLQKYQQVFGYRPIVITDFVPTLLPDESVNGRPAYVVRLDKKGDGDFRSQTVWIDKENFTSPRRLYLYRENGRIDVSFTWRKERDWLVIDRMDAQFDFPKVGATASVRAQYGGYQFNSGLDDGLFVERKNPRPR